MVQFLAQVLKLINYKALANMTREVISVKQLLSEFAGTATRVCGVTTLDIQCYILG
jgi:hypothetical protein